MGTSHIESNMVGKDGTETITGFQRMQADQMVCATVTATVLSAPTVTVTTQTTSPIVDATSYVKIGTGKYIFSGNAGFSASIVAAATALTATNTLKGAPFHIATMMEPNN